MEYDRIYSIRKGEYFADAAKTCRKRFYSYQCIINKLRLGLGATHCELTAPRKSIIIEPNVPVIESKARVHKNALAVYKGVSIRQIADFLETNREEGLQTTDYPRRLQQDKGSHANGGYRYVYGMLHLVDECEKLVQDVHYRDSIREPMNDFFRFQNKALISATPIVPRKGQSF